jgi:hypothetical protein
MLDSKEGITRFVEWARAHKIVCYQYHAQIARKHGVPTDGLNVAGAILASTPSPSEPRTVPIHDIAREV